MMQVLLRFNNQNHEFNIPKDANLEVLQDEITKKLEIPKERQKIVLRGKPLNTNDVLTQGMKLLLMASASPGFKSNTSINQPRMPNMRYKPQIIDTLKEPQHRFIINKGLPEGFLPTSQYETAVLPKVPFVVKNTEGLRTTLSFESDAIFSQASDGSTERIFCSNIKAMSLIPIDTYPGYLALGMMTNEGNRWFYFIPQQYQKLIRAILSN